MLLIPFDMRIPNYIKSIAAPLCGTPSRENVAWSEAKALALYRQLSHNMAPHAQRLCQQSRQQGALAVITKSASTLRQVLLSPHALGDTPKEGLMEHARELNGMQTVYYIALGVVFAALRERFPRQSEFYKYIAENGRDEKRLEKRSVQVYMRVYKAFWLGLDKHQQHVFLPYYAKIPLNRLELLGRDKHSQRWFIGNDAIILEDCRGEGQRVDKFRNLAELKEALKPKNDDETEHEDEAPRPEQDRGLPQSSRMTPVVPAQYTIESDNGQQVRIEGINMVVTDDGKVELLPGAVMAVWFEYVPGPGAETQRIVKVYDGDTGTVREMALPDHELGSSTADYDSVTELEVVDR